jgi:hypothetical protein
MPEDHEGAKGLSGYALRKSPRRTAAMKLRHWALLTLIGK